MTRCCPAPRCKDELPFRNSFRGCEYTFRAARKVHSFQPGIDIHIAPESVFTSLRKRYSHAPEYAVKAFVPPICVDHVHLIQFVVPVPDQLFHPLGFGMQSLLAGVVELQQCPFLMPLDLVPLRGNRVPCQCSPHMRTSPRNSSFSACAFIDLPQVLRWAEDGSIRRSELLPVKSP